MTKHSTDVTKLRAAIVKVFGIIVSNILNKSQHQFSPAKLNTHQLSFTQHKVEQEAQKTLEINLYTCTMKNEAGKICCDTAIWCVFISTLPLFNSKFSGVVWVKQFNIDQ